MLRPEEFPDAVREEFLSIREAMTSVAASAGEGTIAATAAQLSDEAALRLVGRIISLYGDMREARCGRRRGLAPTENTHHQERPVGPRWLMAESPREERHLRPLKQVPHAYALQNAHQGRVWAAS